MDPDGAVTKVLKQSSFVLLSVIDEQNGFVFSDAVVNACVAEWSCDEAQKQSPLWKSHL